MALLDDEKKRNGVTLPATGALAEVPKPAPALKRNDPYNPTFAPAASGAGSGRAQWGSDLPYASNTNRPVMTGTTTVPNAKPMPLQTSARPVGDAPGTQPVTVPALTRTSAPGTSSTQARQAPSQSMTLDQADARERAAATASPASRQTDVGASVSAGGGSADEVIGTFNGRKITRGQSDALAGKLPTASGPVIAGPNGSFAAATGGDSAQVPLLNRGNYGMSFQMPDAPRAATYDLRQANEADAKLRSDIDSQLFRLSFAAGRPGRDGRAAKEAMAQLIGLQGRSIEGQGKRATDIAGGDRDASVATNRTGAEVATSDADRALRADLGAADVLLRRDGQAADSRRVSQVLNGEDGGVALLRNDGSLSQATNPDGSAFKVQRSTPRDYAAEADDKLFSDLLANQVDAVGNPLPDAIGTAQQQFQTIRSTQGRGGEQAPAGMKQVGTSNGKPVYEDANGKRFTY